MDLTTDAKPIEVTKFWANRSGEAIIINLVQFHGRWCLDARRNYTNKEGLFAPINKGSMIALGKLPEFTKALARAERKAIELGLLDGGDE
jgi:hypothetical protein